MESPTVEAVSVTNVATYTQVRAPALVILWWVWAAAVVLIETSLFCCLLTYVALLGPV